MSMPVDVPFHVRWFLTDNSVENSLLFNQTGLSYRDKTAIYKFFFVVCSYSIAFYVWPTFCYGEYFFIQMLVKVNFDFTHESFCPKVQTYSHFICVLSNSKHITRKKNSCHYKPEISYFFRLYFFEIFCEAHSLKEILISYHNRIDTE